MPSTCTFNLSNVSEIYYAGEDKIIGWITLKTTSEKRIKKIKIRFKGVTRCGFKNVIHYAEDESPFELDDIYWSSKETLTKTENMVQQSGVLPAGKHIWQFSFDVPAECPTSMEGANGHIRYELSVKIYNEQKYKNVFLWPITVLKRDDLNARRDCIVPKETIAQATFCCGLIHFGPKLDLRCYFAGYAPGQWLNYTLHVFNKVVATVYEYKITFIRQVKYTAVRPAKCKKVEETIIYHSTPTGNPLSEQVISDAIYIPPTPPTTKTNYISVQYFLRVTLAVRDCRPSVRAELPIPIGTAPLKESLPSTQQRELADVDTNQQYRIRAHRYSRPYMYEPNFVDLNTESINRVDNFLPYYPIYRYASSNN